MKLKAFALFVASLGVLYAQTANAGFTSIHLTPSSSATSASPSYQSDPSTGSLGVQENWDVTYGSSFGFDVWGETDEDPPLHIRKDVNNGTNLTWIGYKLDLSLSDPHTFELLSPVPSSDKMTLLSSSPYSLVFGLPSAVAPGENVQFDFVVNVVTTGGFSFTLTQMPIPVPEPAACVLILVGAAMGSLGYRRRRS